MTTIGRIVASVAGTSAPIAILDTCILLDIVRAPARKKAAEVRVAKLFLSCVGKTPKTIHLFVGSPTPKEWSEHIDTVVQECEDAIETCENVASVCAHLGMTTPSPLPAGTGTLPASLRQLSNDLLTACVVIDHQADAMDRAGHRIIESRLPARKKGTGAKDSIIVEHAIELTRQLRKASFNQSCVFISSNTTDFAAPSSTDVNPELAAVFAGNRLGYEISLENAERTLMGAGWTP